MITRRLIRTTVTVALVCGSLLAWTSTDSFGQAACVDYTASLSGCQPSSFEIPQEKIPGTRVNAQGQIDHLSSDADAIAGAFKAEQDLHLVRNFEHLFWIPLVPSVTDPATGAKSGGDLEAKGDGRGFAVSGNCIFVGHGNGRGSFHPIDILTIGPDPAHQPPTHVGTIAPVINGDTGYDDRELRAVTYNDANGQPTMVLMRAVNEGQDGHQEFFNIDPSTCLPINKSSTYLYGGEIHEFFMWQDSHNPWRVLAATSTYSGAGRPDPNNPGGRIPDIKVMAVTDEHTGQMLAEPTQVVSWSLEQTGGPPHDEMPDATGLFRDGRFPDFTQLVDSYGRNLAPVTMENNYVHSLTVSDDGERIYVAGAMAGFYILNSEGLARNSNQDLLTGRADCNRQPTNVYVGGTFGGQIDVSKLPELARDCVHMVINDDPGVKALLASNMPAEQKISRYLQAQDRSRFDPYPPVRSGTAFHSAVTVPNRPAMVKDNVKQRPSLVVVSDEQGTDCPLSWVRILNIDSEVTPTQHSSYATPINELQNCLTQSPTEPNGEPRSRKAMQAHNPTVFKDLIFQGWYAQGIRVMDISQSLMPREVGYIVTVPQGHARTYPVFKDGLMYWIDNATGLHIARYTGPFADEIPGPGSGTYEGNSTTHK